MANTIQEFLIGLGFKVDQGQQNRFTDALTISHDKIQALGKGMTGIMNQFSALATAALGAGIGISAALIKIGRDMAALGFSAERIGSSAAHIRAYEYAIKQMGGTAEGARATLEQLAALERASPGLLESGFEIKDPKNTVGAMLQLGQRWEKQIKELGANGIANVRAEAARLNIDDAQMLRMVNPQTRGFYGEETGRQKNMGIDFDKITAVGTATTRLLETLQQQFSNFMTYLAGEWGPRFNRVLSSVTIWVDANTPAIKRYFDGMKTNIDGAATAAKKWYHGLDPATADMLEKTALFAAGALALKQGGALIGMIGRLLGLGALAGPIGVLTALSFGILALANDYETWKESGGKDGLIDWEKWKPGIENAITAVKNVTSLFDGFVLSTIGWENALARLVKFMSTSFIGNVFDPLEHISSVVKGIVSLLDAATYKLNEILFGAERTQRAERIKQIGPNATENQADWAWNLTPGPMPEAKGRKAERNWLGQLSTGPIEKRKDTVLDERTTNVAEDIMSFFRLKGYSENEQAGIAANALRESSGNPYAVNATGHAGLFQWDTERRGMFERRYGHGVTAKLDANGRAISQNELMAKQLEFMHHEMQTTEIKGRARMKSESGTAGGAAVGFGQGVERYGKDETAEDASRYNLGEQLSQLQKRKPNLSSPVLVPSPANSNNQSSLNQSNRQSSVNVDATSNITVNGVNDPQRVATLVDQNQQRHGANMLRHLQPVYS